MAAAPRILAALLVQGFVIVTMFTLVHRKWRDASCHLMSKVGGVTVFAGVPTMYWGLLHCKSDQFNYTAKIKQTKEKDMLKGYHRCLNQLDLICNIKIL